MGSLFSIEVVPDKRKRKTKRKTTDFTCENKERHHSKSGNGHNRPKKSTRVLSPNVNPTINPTITIKPTINPTFHVHVRSDCRPPTVRDAGTQADGSFSASDNNSRTSPATELAESTPAVDVEPEAAPDPSADTAPAVEEPASTVQPETKVEVPQAMPPPDDIAGPRSPGKTSKSGTKHTEKNLDALIIGSDWGKPMEKASSRADIMKARKGAQKKSSS